MALLEKRKAMNKPFIQLTKEHLPVIKRFIINNIQTKHSSEHDKLIVNCPYCQDTKFHGIINLTWNNFYCFKCKESKTIFKYFKDYDLLDEFYYVMAEDLGVCHYDMARIITSLTIQEYKEKTANKESNFSKFINDYKLLHISEVSSAYEYALKRTNGDIEEIDNYFVDENYIYIPIINNYEVSHLVGRKYHDIGKSPRYYNLSSKDIEKYHFSKPSESFSFLDEVVSNPKTNVLYITEGYFDAYSVNKSMNDYVAISLLGKNLSKNGLEILKHNFTPFTKIKIVLDSIEKDKGNVESILNLSKRLQSYYPDTEIVVLKHSDPNDIFTSMGPDHLRIIMKNQSTRIHDFAIQNQIRIPKGTASNVNLRKFITDWK